MHCFYSVDNQPTLRDLCNHLLPNLAPNWNSFAIAVDLDRDGTILGIIEQKYHDDLEACCRMLFRKWLQQEKPTWRRVIACLREAKCVQLAIEVEEKVTGLEKKRESHEVMYTNQTTTNSKETDSSKFLQPGQGAYLRAYQCRAHHLQYS